MRSFPMNEMYEFHESIGMTEILDMASWTIRCGHISFRAYADSFAEIAWVLSMR